ncbi:uncharacterized protein LOC143769183 isoform X2 [Ranitomeya variabilis]|uniref:uncharacterized protein LOC143769183 isoform X2 n=1 Tax=Ranitomeya variabilis TaxID=490064 RepID=UPI004056E83F
MASDPGKGEGSWADDPGKAPSLASGLQYGPDGNGKLEMVADFSMATTGEDEYRMAASRGSLGDFYLRQECVFGPGYFSSYPCTKEEREQQLLIYCTRFLPSPIFKMERLMPTNREAQKKYLPFPLDDEKPEPTSMPEEPKEEEMEMPKDAMKYRDIKVFDEDEAEDMEETEEEDEKASEVKKEVVQENSNSTRRVQKQPARRQKIRQQSILQYVTTNLRGRRNIIWTILLKAMRR